MFRVDWNDVLGAEHCFKKDRWHDCFFAIFQWRKYSVELDAQESERFRGHDLNNKQQISQRKDQ